MKKWLLRFIWLVLLLIAAFGCAFAVPEGETTSNCNDVPRGYRLILLDHFKIEGLKVGSSDIIPTITVTKNEGSVTISDQKGDRKLEPCEVTDLIAAAGFSIYLDSRGDLYCSEQLFDYIF